MTEDLVLTNATLVLPDRQLLGTLVLRAGVIADIQPGRSTIAGAVDCEGDLIMPGLIDLHTDNLERQVLPRSNARWPSRNAFLAHDAQCAVAGVTTVFDALCLGDIGFEKGRADTCANGIADLDALTEAPDLLRAEHLLHLRCELPAPGLIGQLEAHAEHPALRMVSLMDHTPGFGQYADLEVFRRLRRPQCADEAELEAQIAFLHAKRDQMRGPNRAALLQRVAGRAVAIASHDDRTEAEVADNAAVGVTISEFPVTMEAAAAATARGLGVIGGAPNLVRGGSHSGNVSVEALLQAGLVDALASDYVPSSLIEAVFAALKLGVAAHQAVALVTANPADMAKLADRGRLAPGLRADLARVHSHQGMPIVRAVWRQGRRVC